jgi:hypothetical protein
MKKIFFLLNISLLFFANIANSQTKEETQDWISEKINYFSYSDDIQVFYNYTISYDQTNMIIKSNCKTKISGFNSTSEISYHIPIKDLYKIRFETKQNNVWLYLKTKSESIKIFSEINYEMTNNVEILLEKSFLENDMRNRMEKAFTHLIKLYGGIVGEEKF